MNGNLEKIKALTNTLDFSGNTSDEYLFTINCVDYFYYSGNIGKSDIIDGFTDGAYDGGIDFIYVEDENNIKLIQGKSSTNLNYGDIRDLFNKMRETVLNFKNNEISQYNKNLKNIFKDVLDNGDNPNIEMVLFTNTYIEPDVMDNIRDNIISSEDYIGYKISVYDADELLFQALKIDQSSMEIPTADLLLDRPKNYLEYDNGKGAIFSIKASSLHDLYEKYSNKGLFGYNLREHISQKNVDDAIDRTIKEDKDNFWFYNNGITIGCKDYTPDGNRLRLYDFSIINGAQTTTKIGESNRINSDNDFSIVCKVIKSEGSLNDEFIRKISAASNSQKPIKFRDLKSNSREQQTIQMNFINSKNKLAIEIKRGVRPKNYRQVQNWERITNEYLGQLLLSCQYLMPGTARSKTSDIFSKEDTYNMLFSQDKVKKYNYESLYEFVRFGHLYDEFKIEYDSELNLEIKLSDNEAVKNELNDKDGICRNGKFVVLAILFYLFKKKNMGLGNKPFSKYKTTLIDCNINIEDDIEIFNKNYKKLFKFIIDRLNEIYNKNKYNMKLTSYSNFFKSDKNFEDIIIPEIDKIYNDEFFGPGLISMLSIFK